MIVTLYRISDAGNPKQKLQHADKISCLNNFIQEFGKQNLYVFADNCKQDTIDELKRNNITPVEISLGNSASFMYILDFAIANFSSDTFVYFLEDDYFHLPKSKEILLEGLAIADYVTLYDHPDKYDTNIEKSIITNTKSIHWRSIGSTTMTFASKVEVLKKDRFIFNFFCFKKGPKDFFLFSVLTQIPVYKILKKPTMRNLIGLFFRFSFLRIPLFNNKRHLISCLPGNSTHVETDYLSPIQRWDKV